MSIIDAADARQSAVRRPLADLEVRRWSATVEGFAGQPPSVSWEAGAEMTNMSGHALYRKGRWLVVLDLGHIIVLNDIEAGIEDDSELVGDWLSPSRVRPMNTRTIVAFNAICRFIAAHNRGGDSP